VAERARAVMGADSAITLDGQSRVAIGITTYTLPRRASPPAKQKPRRTNVGADGGFEPSDAALVDVAVRRLLRRNPLVFDELVAGGLRSEEVEV
jgi:hypothetical protein